MIMNNKYIDKNSSSFKLSQVEASMEDPLAMSDAEKQEEVKQ